MLRGNHGSRYFVMAGAIGLGLLFPLHTEAETIWIHASDARVLSGAIVFGQKTGVMEEGAMGDFLTATMRVYEDDLIGGYAEYQVTIPESATYYVWARLRYPFGVNESFAFIPQGETLTADMSRCLGNSGVGVRQWHWDSQGSGSECKPGTGRLCLAFQAGPLTFRVYPRRALARRSYNRQKRPGRPMFMPRLNILCLTTDPNYVPTDSDAKHALGVEETQLDPLAPKVKTADLPPVSDEELKRLGKQRIPDWLRCPRMFTKDSWRAEVPFRHPGDMAIMVRHVAANGGNIFRVSGYWGGDAYFQSKVTPHAPGLGKLDFLREAIDAGKETGVKIIMYMNPTTLYKDHPLWPEVAVRDAQGNRSENGYGLIPGSPYICNNNPKYRDFLRRFLTEAFTEYGPDGIYIDGMPRRRCFCEHCRDEYKKMFGQEMPVVKIDKHPQWQIQANWWEMSSPAGPVGDPGDPDVLRYTQFFCQNYLELTRLVHDTVTQCKPDAAVIIHTWPKPEAIGYYDASLTEVYLQKPWEHGLWKFGELANYANIFPVPMIFNTYPRDHGTETDARIKMFQGLANGCYPNNWTLVGMKPVFQFMQENAQYFDFLRTSPVRFLAFPRGVIDSAAKEVVKSRTLPELKPVRDRFLAPYVGCYSAIVRNGLPVVSQQPQDFHKHLGGYKVLCLANEACLSDEQIEAVRQFVASGGGLVATHETSLYDEKGNHRRDFGLADVFGGHYDGMLPAASRRVRFDSAHPITKHLDTLSPLIHDDTHVVIRMEEGKTLASLTGTVVTGVSIPAVVANTFGAGRVVYLPGRVDGLQCEQITPVVERLFGHAIRWVAGEQVPVRVDASAPINVTLFDQPDRRILHLVNLNGDSRYKNDGITPIEDITVELQVPQGRQVQRLHRLWDKSNVAFESVGKRIRFTLSRMDLYEVVVAELTSP